MFDDDSTYAGVDGFFHLGDFSSVGAKGDYQTLKNTLDAHVRKETSCIVIHGNHEFKTPEFAEYFTDVFGYGPDTVTEINGFSCIAFSGYRGVTEWTFTPDSLKWLSKEIKVAEKKADGKPVFVFNHPHIWGTVYGSTVWGDPQLNPIFAGHNAVVDFSGHSHFPMSDPRSINQSTFTAVGCGATRTFELDKNFITGQHPDGYDPAAEMCICEADSNGAVHIRGYDLNYDTYFCDYFIENVNDTSSYAYTYKNMAHNDSKPVFPSDTSAEAFRNEDGEWVISFDEATTNSVVHEYKITILDSKLKKVYSDNLINDYFVHDGSSKAQFRIGSDTLKEGENYSLYVRAESAYHLYSKNN